MVSVGQALKFFFQLRVKAHGKWNGFAHGDKPWTTRATLSILVVDCSAL